MARTRSTVHNRPDRPIFRRSLLAMAIVGMTVSAQAQEADEAKQQEAAKEGVEIIEWDYLFQPDRRKNSHH